MHSPHASKSTSTVSVTATSTSTTVIASGVSQTESAAGQCQQGSFVGLSTTAHTPESTRISSTYYQQDEGLSSEIGTAQIAPFETLTTDLADTFDGDYQGQSASSLSLPNKPSRSQKSSQPVDDVPIVRKESNPDPTNKWIMHSGDEKRPLQCGHVGCGRTFNRMQSLRSHLIRHSNESKLRCYAGNCSGTVKYRDKRTLTRHIHSNHTFEKPYQCEICKKWYRRPDYLNLHRKYVHSPEKEKKSLKPESVSNSSSATTTTNTAGTSTITSGNSQPESAAGQRHQDSSVGLSTTIHTPESTQISSTYYQQDEMRLLSDISVSDINASQTNFFEALATYTTATFDGGHQGQSASSLSLSNGPSRSQKSSQPVDDVVPIVRDEPSPDPTDKWIILTDDKKKPFKCGYEGCGSCYSSKHNLRLHFVKHTGNSPYRCYMGECTGEVAFCRRHELTRHIRVYHTFERPFECKICKARFRRTHHLKYHREYMHSPEKEKESPKPQSVSKSSSAATTTITAIAGTSTMTAGQRQQGSFVDLSKTIHTPEPTLIPATDYQQDELGLLSDISFSDISSSQFDPFGILATHQTVTFEDQDQDQFQEQLDEFPLPFDELLQSLNDFYPMVIEDPDDVNLSILSDKNDERISNRTTISIPEHEILPPNNDHFRQALTGIVPEEILVGITGNPKLPSNQHQTYQRSNPIDKWIKLTGDKKKPFKCGYKGCDRRYTRKHDLQRHFVKHTGDSPHKCYLGKCNGRTFPREQELIWHIRSEHTFERPFQCEVCSQRFIRSNDLRSHRKHKHSTDNEKKSPKRKKK